MILISLIRFIGLERKRLSRHRLLVGILLVNDNLLNFVSQMVTSFTLLKEAI